MQLFRLFFFFNLFFCFCSFAASFNCDHAKGRIENLICDSSDISELDSVLQGTYQAVLRTENSPEAVRSDQKLWLTNVRNRCKNDGCMLRVYEERVLQLEKIWHTNERKIDEANLEVRTNLNNPFAGVWQRCQLWKGNEICGGYVLIQQQDRVCGTWEYWATNRSYAGNLQAIVNSNANEATKFMICGTRGSETQTECESEFEPAGGWQRTNGMLSICDGRLIENSNGKSCRSFSKYDGLPFRPLQKKAQESLLAQPWIKSCLVGNRPSPR